MTLIALVRKEQLHDHDEISNVINEAFRGMPYASGDEAELVVALRRVGALSVSFVAEVDGAVIGQIALSPARAADGSVGWYALGPVAVLPRWQGLSIGAQLVEAGLQAIVELGAIGCILTGSPTYYSRFGFRLSASNTPPNEPVEFFMIKQLGQHVPEGPIYFHEAFHEAFHDAFHAPP